MCCQSKSGNIWHIRIILAIVMAISLLIISFPEYAGAQESSKSLPVSSAEKSEHSVETSPTLSSILTQTIVFIYEDNTPTNSSSIIPGRILGTAFIVGIPVSGRAEQSFPFIATAKHVIANRSKIIVRFNPKSGIEPVFVPYDLQKLRNDNDLWESDDEGVDIIMFRSPSYNAVTMLTFPVDWIASKETFSTEYINVTDRVMIPCLMTNYPGISKNYPIFRDGSIALITDEPIPINWNLAENINIKTSQSLIFVNATLNEGFSGAPVFFWPQGARLMPGNKLTYGGKPWLIGVVHGFFPNLRNIFDEEGHKVMITKQEPSLLTQINPPKLLEIYSQENPGTGIVFPAWNLLKILQSDIANKRIQALSEKTLSNQKKK